MIDLDNNTRLILFTMALQQAGHAPARVRIDVVDPAIGIQVECTRCGLRFERAAYHGVPELALDVAPCLADAPLARALRTLQGS